MDDAPVLDEGALERLEEWGGPKLVVQMIRLYVENARTRLAQLDRSLSDGGDPGDAEMAAHSLKSSAANVGFLRVSALAARIEAAAESGRIDDVRDLRGALGDAVDEAERVASGRLPRGTG